jgi:hypothetical protein
MFVTLCRFTEQTYLIPTSIIPVTLTVNILISKLLQRDKYMLQIGLIYTQEHD